LKNFDVSTEFQAVSDRQTDGQTLWQQILHLCAGKNNVLSLSLSLQHVEAKVKPRATTAVHVRPFWTIVKLPCDDTFYNLGQNGKTKDMTDCPYGQPWTHWSSAYLGYLSEFFLYIYALWSRVVN